MKILYLVHQFYPQWHLGTEKFVLQLARHCQAAGHEVKIVTYDFPLWAKTGHVRPVQRLKQKMVDGLRAGGIDLRALRAIYFPVNQQRLAELNEIIHHTYIYEGLSVIAFRYQHSPKQFHQRLHEPTLRAFAAKILDSEQPALIHAAHTIRMAEFLHVAIEQRIPYLLTLTDYWLLCPHCRLQNERRQLCQGPRNGDECRTACPSLDPLMVRERLSQAHHLLTHASAIVAPSRFLAGKLRAEMGPLPIKIIPYGMDMAQLPANTRSYPTTEPLVFLFAGILTAHKGIHLLVKAFRRLPSSTIRLVIYGSGPLETDLHQQASDDARITLGGVYTQDQLGAILQKVDLVVVPSTWYENLPLIMQEAQACSVPTLVSDVGGMTECVADGVNGFTFRVGDVDDLQRKLQLIIDQPEILNKIKKNLQNPQPGQYQVTSLEEEGDIYLAEYEKIRQRI